MNTFIQRKIIIEKSDNLIAQNQGTAKNGLSLSNTLSVGDASSGGTANITAGMNANSTGQVSGPMVLRDRTYLRVFSQASGAFSVDNTYRPNERPSGATGVTSTDSFSTLKMNIAHTHNVYLRGSVSLGNGDSETRPENYTIRIWKRIS